MFTLSLETDDMVFHIKSFEQSLNGKIASRFDMYDLSMIKQDIEKLGNKNKKFTINIIPLISENYDIFKKQMFNNEHLSIQELENKALFNVNNLLLKSNSIKLIKEYTENDQEINFNHSNMINYIDSLKQNLGNIIKINNNIYACEIKEGYILLCKDTQNLDKNNIKVQFFSTKENLKLSITNIVNESELKNVEKINFNNKNENFISKVLNNISNTSNKILSSNRIKLKQ